MVCRTNCAIKRFREIGTRSVCLQRALNNAKALYEENKSLGFTANMIEVEGCLRGLTHVNETIEWDLKEYFTEV